MTHSRPPLTLGALTLTLLLACSGPSVQYDYDAGAPFPAYRSYAWQLADPDAAAGPQAFDSAIETGRVRRAVEAELGSKGFSHQEDSPNPDFLVTYYAVREPGRSQQVHLGLGFGMGPLGLGVSGPVGDRHRQASAGIALEIQDGNSGAVVWKATAEGALQEADSPEEADAGVKAAVHTMLQRFPPPAK
jgi:hypothetical protein